jgi:aminoglycoside phosphotransferase (APT) family kinase protein
VAQLVRQFHDLTAGTDLAGGQEVVCHNDLSPTNTVYRGVGARRRPAAFIDWDIAAPGERVHDVAHVCWQYLDLGPDTADAAETARLVRLIADSYGMADRSGLVDTILWAASLRSGSRRRRWPGSSRASGFLTATLRYPSTPPGATSPVS